jgi:hypothetical protein
VSVIYGSLLLILVAVVMFGVGLAQGSNAFMVMSIAASLLAAILVVLGIRQAAAARAALGRRAPEAEGLGTEATGPSADDRSRTDLPREPGRRRSEGTVYGREAAPAGGEAAPAGGEAATEVMVADEPEEVSIPGQATGTRHLEFDLEQDTDDEDPPDEPAAQLVTPADADRVSRMSAQVLVVDGRPRYHQAGCVHLLGRESEPLPVSEAVELGFTPCSLCEPDSALLAEARRV